MSGSDAILVVEDWISEYFFGSTAASESFHAEVLALRKEWDAEASEKRPTPRSRFTAARGILERELATLGEPGGAGSDLAEPGDPVERVAAVHDRLRQVLGYGSGLHLERRGPLTRVSAPGLAGPAPLVIIEALGQQVLEDVVAKDVPTLAEPVVLDSGDELKSAARLVSAVFVADDAPTLALVLAGRWAVLAERARWAEGRYLAVDVQTVVERNDTRRGGEVDRLLACLGAASCAPDADGALWWSRVLDSSVRHTVGVSKDLRDGVRASVEIIANEVVGRRTDAGLPPLPADQAQPLARQSLRFLYRILFLLFAEASPELGVLPVGAPEYTRGYSLDRLRELVQVPLTSPRARSRRHLYESLTLLFRRVDRPSAARPAGQAAERPVVQVGEDLAEGTGDGAVAALDFQPLRADLFRPEATALIDEVGLGDAALQEVLARLLLSRESRGRDRGFISYAELGINQLGKVYEGLMSYTGFFADTDLYEVAKDGDTSKGSWVVPVERAEGIRRADLVSTRDDVTGELRPVVHRRGSFVFRLAGRDRQQSASYYTPEELTRFTVGQALAELLGEDGDRLTAREILDLTVCEPALGSGAFAIEAVHQLAEAYLKRRQAELGERIDPDEFGRRRQEVKAYLALHNVYGVDLNATAVELAEITLWLATMVPGLEAPWFGLHLRRGNSLVGGRRATFRRSQVEKGRAWLTAVPTDLPLAGLAAELADGRVGEQARGLIHHFLLPSPGWGSAVDVKEAKDLAPDALDRLRTWRKTILAAPTTEQVTDLVELAHRVEQLWQFALRRLRISEAEVRRAIPVWGAEGLREGGAVQRAQIEAALQDPDGAFGRLRRVMDAWSALSFWPLTDATTHVTGPDGVTRRVAPPAWGQWIAGLRALLGRSGEGRRRTPRPATAQPLTAALDWEDLAATEVLDLEFAGALPVERALVEHPWLRVCERVAANQGFFHWDLDFAPVFADRGGFDLQVGNPPWVRPDTDVDALLAEGDPWWQLAGKPTQAEVAVRRRATLALPGIRDLVLDGTADIVGLSTFLGSVAEYPHTAGLRPDLYRCFMQKMWRNNSANGASGMIHPETHFTDEKAQKLRKETYSRLRRHWQFINELRLFEIHNLVSFGIHIYSTPRHEPRFLMASSLYHPDTVIASLRHDGSGPEPGLKDPNGRWDVRPHRNRIVTVDRDVLRTWHELLEDDSVPVDATRMVYAVNSGSAAALRKLASLPRLGDLGLDFCRGWNETTDRKKGYFEAEWGIPADWDDVILQGPHLHVNTPFYKSPNAAMSSNKDWSVIDLEALPPDAVPVTSYKPRGDRYRYDAGYTHWGPEDNPLPARDYYRIAWRAMAANANERTLISALIPPGVSHVDGVFSAGSRKISPVALTNICGVLGSIVSDFTIRSAPKAHIRAPQVQNLVASQQIITSSELLLRTLRLNCVTDAYAELFNQTVTDSMARDCWTGGLSHRHRVDLGDLPRTWTQDVPLRIAADRRQAQVEIDALVALLLGLTADELCTIYRTQFPVLHGYDRNVYLYDANGRLVPNQVLTAWRKKGDRITLEEQTATNQGGNTYVYEPPFVALDREADMRRAYEVFADRLGTSAP